MTNERINMTATNERRILALQEDAKRLANPIMPTIIRRPPPKARRHSVPRRSIR